MERLLASFVLGLVVAAPAAEAQSVSVQRIGPRTNRIPVRAGFPLTALTPLWSQGGLGPVEIDQSNGGAAAGDGTPLSIGGQAFTSGLGTHATSAIAYDLGGKGVLFASWVGVDDSAGSAGSVSFEVWTDGALAFDSGVLTGNDGPTHTGRVDVRGVHELVLVVRDGGDGGANDLADWADPFVIAFERPAGDGALVRATRGEWEPAMAWPLEPQQAVVLDSGDLLTFANESGSGAGADAPGAPHDATRADLADTNSFGHAAVDHPTEEVFGAGLARLSDGTLLAAGGFAGRSGGAPLGQDQASRFDAGTGAWIPAANGPLARWGATGLSLGNGFVLAIGGVDGATLRDNPARFDGERWDELVGLSVGDPSVGDPRIDGTFPYAHLAPDGRVLVTGWDEDLALFDTRGAGDLAFNGTRESRQRAWGAAASASPERLLIVGGVDHGGSPGEATRTAVTVDVSGATPSVAPTGDMLFARADHDATVLADGSVLVTGGGRFHADGSPDTAVRVAELWDPNTGQWSLAAASAEPRGYRSTAVLLPDGRVWTGGGACGAGCTTNTSAEVFRPPYLFDANGQPAARPTIQSAPAFVAYGDAFQVQMASGDAISRVTLVRLGSATHGVNTDQRFLELAVSQNGASLDLVAPEHGNVAPPGGYMLFAFDASGAPSVARIVKLGLPSPTSWEFLPSSNGSLPTCRHEAAMVTVDGKLYLMGGRGATKPTEEYDPVTGEWRTIGQLPFEMHHYQPVVLDGLVYVVGAFTGNYPNENNVNRIWTWDPNTNVWTQGPSIPSARRRGAAGTFVRDGKIYLIGGNNMGHNGGARPWFDEYDPVTQNWTVLPDAPRARDHFLSVLIGDRLVYAGGRTTTQPNPFTNTVREVDVYDFSTGTWSTLGNDIPTERAGTMAVPVGRFAVVVGGESNSMVPGHEETEALDVLTDEWVTLPDLVDGRHSGGIGVVDGRIYVASGSGDRGGTPELDTLEVLGARDALDAIDPNLLVNGAFDAGFDGWDVTGATSLVPDGGVAAPAVRIESGGDIARTSPAASSTTYTARAFYASSGAGAATLTLEALDGGGGVLGSSSTALAVSSDLRRAELTWTTPSGTQDIRLRLSATGGRTARVDDVVLVVD